MVREMRRLDELMRNLELAAKVKHVHSMLQILDTANSHLPAAYGLAKVCSFCNVTGRRQLGQAP